MKAADTALATTASKNLLDRLPSGVPIPIRACFLGERLHLRGLYDTPIEFSPLVLPAGEKGLAMLFRYGAVIFFNLSESEQKAFLKEIRKRVEKHLSKIESEETQVLVSASQAEGSIAEGVSVSELSLPRLQVIAIVLARSVALAYYEAAIAKAFDVVEPLALQLENEQGSTRKLKGLLRQISQSLLVQHKMIGRVEIQDKPELLWDQPELERLYLRLEAEYELRERSTVLDRKLALISRSAETSLDLLHNHRMLRVEWYIVILIVIDVALYSYDIWFK